MASLSNELMAVYNQGELRLRQQLRNTDRLKDIDSPLLIQQDQPKLVREKQLNCNHKEVL
jgi:hypothetical protein